MKVDFKNHVALVVLALETERQSRRGRQIHCWDGEATTEAPFPDNLRVYDVPVPLTSLYARLAASCPNYRYPNTRSSLMISD
jgi:hypothetical protein